MGIGTGIGQLLTSSIIVAQDQEKMSDFEEICRQLDVNLEAELMQADADTSVHLQRVQSHSTSAMGAAVAGIQDFNTVEKDEEAIKDFGVTVGMMGVVLVSVLINIFKLVALEDARKNCTYAASAIGWIVALEWVFIVIFAAEVVWNAMRQGKAYWSAPRHVFEYLCNLVSFLVITAYSWSEGARQHLEERELQHFVAWLQIFRLIRAIDVWEQVQKWRNSRDKTFNQVPEAVVKDMRILIVLHNVIR